MEAAGLAIGTVSLFGLFKSCLELYDTIECGRQYGVDYEVLTTKVGVERVRLSLWGHTIGLMGLEATASPGADLDPRLHDTRIVKAVADVLSCMKHLFHDTGELTRRYGLRPATSEASDGAGHKALSTTFRRTYERLQARALQTQRATGLAMTARWAVQDKKRFQLFINDLRGFNDSLSALFPDIGSEGRKAMVAEIKESTDLDSLQAVEQAVADMDGDDGELAEAASLRITQISQHSADSQTVDSRDTNGRSARYVGDVNVNHLARQLEKLEATLQSHSGGSLRVTIWKSSYGTKHTGFVSWHHKDGEENYYNENERKGYVQVAYPAWSLMHTPEREMNKQCDYSDQDSEASRKFEGRYPGTRTVEGYAASFSEWAKVHIPDDSRLLAFTTVTSISRVPEHTDLQLVNRLRDLQARRSLPQGQTDRAVRKDMEGLMGKEALLQPARGVSYDMNMQISDLLSTLNRGDIYHDVRVAGSLGIIMRHQDFLHFLYQMVLGYELKLRLAHSTSSFGNVTERVVAAVHAAERWIDGVLVKLPDRRTPKFEFHSLVHERQVEGLVRFAERLAWPALDEMREFAENTYANLRAGMNVGVNLWDWLFGLTLPGNAFVFTIMSALIQATPSIRELDSPRYFESGLVLDDRSYWRSKTVLGRVLGGIRGGRAANGWVGPCPVPVRGGVAGSGGDKVTKGWWPIAASDVPFVLPPTGGWNGWDEPDVVPGLHRGSKEPPPPEWVRVIGDHCKFVVPVGPRSTPDKVELQALLFEDATGVRDKNGLGEKETFQKATLELTINGTAASFALDMNPVFVAAPECINGPHAVRERTMPELQNVVRVSQLPGYVRQGNRVLVIDATGEGECELAARAWCAQAGQQAVLRRGPGTCFACAVRAAGSNGLGLGCLIWTW